jgi:hypothetical protein
MSNKENSNNQMDIQNIPSRKPISNYQQLSGLINALKSDEITINDVMNKIQLKDSRPVRPYCKVTSTGSLALYGITKQPIVLYAEQWNKLLKITRSSYIDNYMKYNESKLSFKNKKNNRNIYDNSNNETILEDIEGIVEEI